MLEIIVDLTRKNGGEIASAQTDEFFPGDIIVAKKQPCVWGNEEKRLFLITYLKDDELEAKIDNNFIVHPYAVYDDVLVQACTAVDQDGNMVQIPERYEQDTVNRSKYRVDLSMFDGSVGLDPNNLTQDPVTPNGKEFLELSDLILDDTFRC